MPRAVGSRKEKAISPQQSFAWKPIALLMPIAFTLNKQQKNS